jgi:hypothetical protein
MKVKKKYYWTMQNKYEVVSILRINTLAQQWGVREPEVANAHTGWCTEKLLDLFQIVLEDCIKEVELHELFWMMKGR